MTHTIPKIGETVESILNAWKELAEKPQMPKQYMAGYDVHTGNTYEWFQGRIWRIWPSNRTHRAATIQEHGEISQAIRLGAFQVELRQIQSMLRSPSDPSETVLVQYHRATGRPLEISPTWVEDPANIFDSEAPDDSIET